MPTSHLYSPEATKSGPLNKKLLFPPVSHPYCSGDYQERGPVRNQLLLPHVNSPYQFRGQWEKTSHKKLLFPLDSQPFQPRRLPGEWTNLNYHHSHDTLSLVLRMRLQWASLPHENASTPSKQGICLIPGCINGLFDIHKGFKCPSPSHWTFNSLDLGHPSTYPRDAGSPWPWKI